MHRRAVLAGGMTAAVWAAAPRAQPAADDLSPLEPVYAASAGKTGLTIRVASTGCATKADFAFYVDRKPGGVSVAFARKPVAACKPARPARADLTFSYAELGLNPGDPVRLLNPVAEEPSAARRKP